MPREHRWTSAEVEKLMQRHDLSRADLAAALPVSVWTVYRWSRGMGQPSAMASMLLDALAERLKRGGAART